MTLEAIFGMASTFAFFSWIALFIFYPQRWLYSTLFSGVFLILGATYAFFIFNGLSGGEAAGGFTTLADVRGLFASDEALLAGWIHYLVFDLFVGMWITKDAWEKDINRWMLLPVLLFTFMMGPLGLMIYFIVRGVKTKQWNQSPFH